MTLVTNRVVCGKPPAEPGADEYSIRERVLNPQLLSRYFPFSALMACEMRDLVRAATLA
jgi:hypothetical protein